MKKSNLVVAVALSASLLSGCGLVPFQEDVPFGKKKENQVEQYFDESTAAQQDAGSTDQAEQVAEGEAAPADAAGQDTAGAETPAAETPVAETPAAEAPAQDVIVETGGDVATLMAGFQNNLDTSTVLGQANLMAAQYDYDGAIDLLTSQSDYSSNTAYMNSVANYETVRDSCVEYPLEEITHVFYHTLIKDVSKAFDGDSDEGGYNQVMTTIDEFNKITQIMYDKGYVMISVHDMMRVNEDGSMNRSSVMLPEGKIPFVLSQDDVSYYHYMDGDGFASRLIVDENGDIKNEYIEDDGSISVGDYDMVPLIETFVKQHPDFSYHGRKGLLCMTGYDGVLGYRTDIAYLNRENLMEDQQAFLDANPDFDYYADVEQATQVATAMKEKGWEFASHTWGHRNATTSSAEELQTDNEKWEAYVAPILGSTDIIVFAFGADIGDWQPYTYDNPKFAYFKSVGYNYYCNVDSSQYWVQTSSDCFRMGRRNLDGYRMYYNPEMLSDLFDVADVWDSSRPTPVPPM